MTQRVKMQNRIFLNQQNLQHLLSTLSFCMQQLASKLKLIKHLLFSLKNFLDYHFAVREKNQKHKFVNHILMISVYDCKIKKRRQRYRPTAIFVKALGSRNSCTYVLKLFLCFATIQRK